MGVNHKKEHLMEDRIAPQLLMETFHLNRISFIKPIKGVEVLEAISSPMKLVDILVAMVSNLQVKLRTSTRSK